ncbi:MAG: hypothetical protein QM813_22800 [Verrucomicrobiota bacterium]
MKPLLSLFLAVIILSMCSCASRSRYRAMQKFYTEPPVPMAYDTNAWIRLGYVAAHIEGFNAYMAGRGNRPDPAVQSLTVEALAADRDGYLAGVAAAYDAWLQYSRTNAVIKK